MTSLLTDADLRCGVSVQRPRPRNRREHGQWGRGGARSPRARPGPAGPRRARPSSGRASCPAPDPQQDAPPSIVEASSGTPRTSAAETDECASGAASGATSRSRRRPAGERHRRRQRAAQTGEQTDDAKVGSSRDRSTSTRGGDPAVQHLVGDAEVFGNFCDRPSGERRPQRRPHASRRSEGGIDVSPRCARARHERGGCPTGPVDGSGDEQ